MTTVGMNGGKNLSQRRGRMSRLGSLRPLWHDEETGDGDVDKSY